MAGGGGGLSVYNMLLFYSVLFFLIVYLSALAGVSIISSSNPANLTPPTNFIDPFQVISFYIALASTNSTYALITIVLIAPFAIAFIYAIMQLIRGTG